MIHIIQNIRTIRKQKGISQESVAYDLGIDYSTYGKIERGNIALTVDRLEKIATILNVTVEELYKWHEVDNNSDEATGGDDSKKFNFKGKDNLSKLQKCQIELESVKRELEYLHEQLKDKEKIIALLEHKLTKLK